METEKWVEDIYNDLRIATNTLQNRLQENAADKKYWQSKYEDEVRNLISDLDDDEDYEQLKKDLANGKDGWETVALKAIKEGEKFVGKTESEKRAEMRRRCRGKYYRTSDSSNRTTRARMR